MPTTQHLAAQQGAVLGLDLDAADRLGVRGVRVLTQLVEDRDLVIDRLGDIRGLPQQRADRPVQGLHHHPGPGVLVSGQRRQPATDRGDRGGRQHPVGVNGGLGDREQRRLRQPAFSHHLA